MRVFSRSPMMKRGTFRKSQSKRLHRDRNLGPGRSSYSCPHLISGLFVLVPFPTITGDGSPVKTASRNARRKRGESLLHGGERRLSGVEQVIGGPSRWFSTHGSGAAVSGGRWDSGGGSGEAGDGKEYVLTAQNRSADCQL